MIPATIVFIYLAIVLYIGIFAFRRSKGSGEDFFLASRQLGPFVFLLSGGKKAIPNLCHTSIQQMTRSAADSIFPSRYDSGLKKCACIAWRQSF